jgi:tetratricopeptide (TPR) repeat protein
VVACLCVAILGRRSDIGLLVHGSACAAAVHDGRPDAVQVCQLEYERTNDPKAGALLAETLVRRGDLPGAKRIAASLLATSARSDALYTLGWIARKEDKIDDAIEVLEDARRLHGFERKWKQLANDDGMLAMVRLDRSEFAKALQLVAECITNAQLDGEASLQRYCHLTAAKTLIRVGYWSAAEHEIGIAKKLVTSGEVDSDLEYQLGSFRQERGDYESAIQKFKSALQHHKRPQDPLWTINTELNLAYSLAERGQIDEAQRYLKESTRPDSEHKKKERTWIAAQIAYRQHDLPLAASLTEKYFELLGHDDSVDRESQIDVATLRARIELERGNLDLAVQWARRGVDQAERVRDAQSTLELRPWVQGKRRASYELLFTALALGHQFEEAAMAFDAWQGRTVQDALARTQQPASLDYSDMARQVDKLGEWLRVASKAPFARSPDRQAVLRTMRDIDLLALIVANDDVWRLTANHGPPQLARLGGWKKIHDLVDTFRGRSTDIELASALGDLLLPDESFRTTPEVLHVVLDGQLGGLPMAALRRGDTPLITMRPVVRLLRLPETHCVDVSRSGHATVLAAPDAKLPNAVAEAEQVAGLLSTAALHVTREIGAGATSAALRAAKYDAVLHVAAHGTLGMDGAALVLADREVPALEISALQVAPSLAVLSACNGAESDDQELAGSLAAGFLGAGSQHVVTTLRSVSDADALEISTRFYREGGVANPVRALAAVQSVLAKTNKREWPLWTVFGLDVCIDSSTDHR